MPVWTCMGELICTVNPASTASLIDAFCTCILQDCSTPLNKCSYNR